MLATDDVRVYRQGQAPGVGRPQATARLAAGGSSPFSLETTFARVAASGDIGLSDGAYRAGPASRGHYLHVWKRVGGRWRLAADVSKEDDAAKR